MSNDPKINFCCIFGGQSSEYEVSLNSAYGVMDNTDTGKYNIIKVGITKEGQWFLYTGDNESVRSGEWINDKNNLTPCFPCTGSRLCIPDRNEYISIGVCFPVVHGANCEDGKLQGLLDMCGIKYVGPGCTSSSAAMDKDFTKKIALCAGIPVADFFTFIKGEMSENEMVSAVEEKFSFPVFVKPCNAGSSVGASKAKSKEELIKAIETAFKEDEKILVEEYIVGHEVETAVMGKGENAVVSTPGEVDPGADFYDYATKYTNDTASYYIPARVSGKSLETVKEYAKKIYTALGCKGLSRVDFFVTDGGRVVFNEINTLPGFTPISMYPKLFMANGMSYSEIVDKLLMNALKGE